MYESYIVCTIYVYSVNYSCIMYFYCVCLLVEAEQPFYSKLRVSPSGKHGKHFFPIILLKLDWIILLRMDFNLTAI